MQQQHADIRARPQSQHFLGPLGQDEDISHIDARVSHDKNEPVLCSLSSCPLRAFYACTHCNDPSAFVVFHLTSHVLDHTLQAYVLATALKVIVGSAPVHAQQQLVFSMCMSSCKLHVSTHVGSVSPQTRQQPVFLMQLVHGICLW